MTPRAAYPCQALLAALVLAAPAHAAPHPAKTLDKLLNKSAGGPERVERNLPAKKAADIEALLSATYGAPDTGRQGVRSWNIPVDNPTIGQADVVGVMLITDSRGKTRIVIDDSQAVGPQTPALEDSVTDVPVIKRPGWRPTGPADLSASPE